MLEKWMSCLKGYKRDTILTPALVTFEVIMDIVIPLLMAHIIDAGISEGNMDVILRTGLWLVLACVVSLITGVFSGRYAARSSAGFAKNVRKKMFSNIQEFSFTNIDRFSTNSLVTRLTTDVTNVQNAFQMIIRICIRAQLMIIFSVVVVFGINVKLAWVFMVMIVILSAGLILIMKISTPLYTKVFKLYDKLNTVVRENVRGIRVVKSFAREDTEERKFGNTSGDIYKNYVKVEKILAFNSPLMQFCMYACTLIVCWLGAKMIVGGSLTTGQLMSLLTYATQILTSLMVLSMVFVMIAMSKASFGRISEVFNEESDMTEPDDPINEISDFTVDFNDVNFGYHGNEGELCLKDINLHIKQGESVGIVGGTGSGKSSLVQLIPRLYDVSSGNVSIGDNDVRKYGLETLRDNIAIVLQKNILFEGTIKDNIRWGNKDATDEEIIDVCKMAQAHEFIESFPKKYDTWIEQGGSNVSGGQKQRLCIARALLKKPKILILGDSTSAVDTKTDALIRRSLTGTLSDMTKFVIAQRITTVKDFDKIIVMDDGCINGIGTHDELVESNEIYSEVYKSQKKEGSENDAA